MLSQLEVIVLEGWLVRSLGRERGGRIRLEWGMVLWKGIRIIICNLLSSGYLLMGIHISTVLNLPLFIQIVITFHAH